MKNRKKIYPRMSRFLRSLPLLTLSAVLAFTALPLPAAAASGTSSGTQSTAITVHTPSREEIVKYMQEHPTGDIYFTKPHTKQLRTPKRLMPRADLPKRKKPPR